MSLPTELVSQLVKTTLGPKETSKETTVRGTTVVDEKGKTWVKLDGSELLTPISTTADVKGDERVTVMIKDHTATVTGNLSSPSARTDDVKEVGKQISEFDIIMAHRVSTDDLTAINATIDNLKAKVAAFENIEAATAKIKTLEATYASLTHISASDVKALNAQIESIQATFGEFTDISAEDLEALNAEITNLKSYNANFTYVSAEKLEATEARIKKLDADKLDVESAKVTYANIDFSNIKEAAIRHIFGETGLIKDLTVGDQTLTGELVGVTISGDLIKANTLKADKLVVKGSDGLYYKLNIEAGAVESAEVSKEDLQNGLHGTAIIAKTITAEKISVSDLVAFGATIGGYHITNTSLYSGVKSSATNTTRGVYLDSDGQMAVGDSNNFLRYYKNDNGDYILEVSADSIRFGAGKKTVDEAIDDISVGGRNLLLDSEDKLVHVHGEPSMEVEREVTMTEWKATNAIRIYGTGGTDTTFAYLSGTSESGAADDQESYVLSVYLKNNHATNRVRVSGNHLASSGRILEPGEIDRVELTGLGNGWGALQINFATINAGDEFDLTYWRPKIEHGNKATDWTPAPEDMASSNDVDEVREEVESVDDKVGKAQSLIDQLSNSISMLVTDGSGTSLMTQTENGWTFSTANIQDAVDTTREGLDALTNELGDTNGVVDALQASVDNLKTIGEYVKIGTYEGEPCIELGEGDSDFKLIITNTRILFMEGSSAPAYMTNQSLYIKKAVVEEELQQGGFVWQARANGNLGLIWKGVTNNGSTFRNRMG